MCIWCILCNNGLVTWSCVFWDETYYSVVRRLPLDSIDPSLAIGFYCRDRGKSASFVCIYRCFMASFFYHLFRWSENCDQLCESSFDEGFLRCWFLLIAWICWPCVSAEFDDLCARSSELVKQYNGAPIFTVAEKSAPSKLQNSSDMGLEESFSKDPSSEDDWQMLWW